MLWHVPGQCDCRLRSSVGTKVCVANISACTHAPSKLSQATPLRHRLVQPVAASSRRRVDNALLDNVDNTGELGNSSTAWSPRSEDPLSYSSLPSAGYAPQTSSSPATNEPSTSPQTPNSTNPYDWQQDTVQRPRGLDPSASVSNAYPYPDSANNRWDADPSPGPTGPTLQNPPSGPPSAASAGPQTDSPSSSPSPTSWAASNRLPPQQPGPAPPPPRLGADWGEVEPLTDWGGGPLREETGWSDEDDLGRPSNAAFPPRGDGTRGGGGSDAGAVGYDEEGRDDTGWSGIGGSGRFTAAGASAAPPYGDGGSGGYDSGAAGGGRWFGQDLRYGTAGGGEWREGGLGARGSGWAGGGPASAGTAATDAGGAAAGTPPPPPGAFWPSDIVRLSGQDAAAVLPLAPNSSQVEYFQPQSVQERIVLLLGSLGSCVLLSKATVLAAPALLYPLWSPWIRAGLKNLDLHAPGMPVVGLWRAEVLEVRVRGVALGGLLLGGQPPRVSLIIGDPWMGGARSTLELPYTVRSEFIRPGDAVECVVLARDASFVGFKPVPELYLPQTGLWLCNYPALNRDIFTSISIAVERERRATAAAAVEVEASYDSPYDGAPRGPGEGPASGQQGFGWQMGSGLGWQEGGSMGPPEAGLGSGVGDEAPRSSSNADVAVRGSGGAAEAGGGDGGVSSGWR